MRLFLVPIYNETFLSLFSFLSKFSSFFHNLKMKNLLRVVCDLITLWNPLCLHYFHISAFFP
jgi:hypothetical protein